jgi:hypothetical protein
MAASQNGEGIVLLLFPGCFKVQIIGARFAYFDLGRLRFACGDSGRQNKLPA